MNKRDWKSMPEPHFQAYKSTALRTPKEAPILLPENILKHSMVRERPHFRQMGELENNLLLNGRINGDPIGQNLLVFGKILDDKGKGISDSLVEIWQANGSGRYIHKEEIHPASLDPNFIGAGRTITDKDGKYEFITLRPGAYPWGDHNNAWRPAHIHFSIWGQDFSQKLITQMYFEGDPMIK